MNMKINRIVGNTSFQKKIIQPDNNQLENPFWYTKNNNYKPNQILKENKYNYLAGILALITALACVKKFTGRNTLPKNIVEIAGQNVGLNKINGYTRTINQLKSTILYPMKSLLMGEKSVLRNQFKTGLIIADKDGQKVEEISNAFLEHAQNLGIKTIHILNPTKRNRIKEVHRAIDSALEYYKNTGKPVIVALRDLSKISNLRISKTESSSNLENRLAKFPKGVLWTAWTTKATKLPYFYNNTPTLCTKLID